MPSTSTVQAPHCALVAALLGAGEAEMVAQRVEQRDAGVERQPLHPSVDVECDRHVVHRRRSVPGFAGRQVGRHGVRLAVDGRAGELQRRRQIPVVGGREVQCRRRDIDQGGELLADSASSSAAKFDRSWSTRRAPINVDETPGRL